MNRNRIFGALILGAFTVLAAAPVDAGSVFLKNGYIIQGRIVESDDEKVVLGFSNGRMTIHSRFIDEVVLLPREVEELEAARKAAENKDVAATGSEREGEYDLPEDLGEIRAMYDPDESLTGPGSVGSVTPNEIPDVDRIAQNAELPVMREFAAMGIKLVTPPEWTVVEEEGFLVFRKSANEPFPSLTIQRHEGGDLTPEVANQVLYEALLDDFPGVRVTDERVEQIGLERAFVTEGEYPEQNLYFSQCLVGHGGRFFLIGLQLANPANQDDLDTLQASLHSVEFLQP